MEEGAWGNRMRCKRSVAALRFHHIEDVKTLNGKRIALCITGSIAAIRAFDLARLLVKQGATVTCVASAEALRFVPRESLEWATGSQVIDKITSRCEHLELAKCDAIVIAPATANTISKIATGIADTPVTLVAQTALGRTPMIIVPTMHEELLNPIVLKNLEKISEFAAIVPPVHEEGKEKFPDANEVVDYIAREIACFGKTRGKLAGWKVAIFGGAFREYIDGVRFIANASSGKFAIALARECFFQGARVTLVHGQMDVPIPRYLETIHVETTTEALNRIKEFATGKDMLMFPAAFNDFAPAKKHGGKLDSAKRQTLALEPLPKAIALARQANKKAVIVGFKALTGKDEGSAGKLLETCDLVVLNDVGKHGFGADGTEITVMVKNKKKARLAGRKGELARKIIDLVID